MSGSTPQSHRCITCKSTSVGARNLAVFIDGTSNRPGPMKTNVMKLYNLVSDVAGPELKQHTYYLEGIGVHDVDDLSLLGHAWKRIYSGLEMALAWNVEKNVMEAYSWLATSYRKGDQIYLFGFSRGAYQVRALAGMIHEVGLVKEARRKRIEQAYRYYLAIDPNNPQTREATTQFKRDFSRPDVRIHFVGVWDTVSSLGLIKRDVHITASASVTNACHFRHALALDERRVRFMPEYFLEVNAHHVEIKSPRTTVSDIKEVWFAGCHSDVGGISRPHSEGVTNLMIGEHNPVHAGNVPLRWMTREAATEGLVFESEEFAWHPEDVDLGRKDTMKWYWRIIEVMRIHHQVSFSGTGKHERRRHMSRPRSIIPEQHIHFSVLPGDVYTPRAILTYGVDIPMVPQVSSGGLWSSELLDEETTTPLLASLLSEQHKTLKSLGEVLLLLNFNNGQTRNVPRPKWSEISIREQSGIDMFALAVIFDVTSNFTISQELVRDAMESLNTILPFPNHPDFPRALYLLRFSARHPRLRRRFIAHDDVINALMLALDRIAESRGENLFPLIMDGLRYLIDDDDQRDNVINRLTARLDGTEAEQTKLSLALEVKAPNFLIASLEVIASLVRYRPDHCEELKPRIIELARKERGPVGAAAIEALIALNVPLPQEVHFSNILDYLGNTLPRLDAEVGGTHLPDGTVALPPVFQVNGSGELDDEDTTMRKLVQTVSSRDAHECTVATLTLLKLCRNQIIQEFCSQNKVLDIFMKLSERKETSLLAAYALNMCLKLNMWKPGDFNRAARLIITMLDKGWFDDAVGRVEGSEIFRELMTSGDLRQQVIASGIVSTLEKKLEMGDRHETRMSLICLNVFWRENLVELERAVADSLKLLKNKDIKNQKRGVKTLSSLAQTEAGEHAIKPRVIEIVKMLLSSDGSPLPRYQLFGPTAVLHNLCRNETLREEILKSHEFADFKRQRQNGALYPQTRKATL